MQHAGERVINYFQGIKTLYVRIAAFILRMKHFLFVYFRSFVFFKLMGVWVGRV